MRTAPPFVPLAPTRSTVANTVTQPPSTAMGMASPASEPQGCLVRGPELAGIAFWQTPGMADFTVTSADGVVTSYSGAEARHDLNSRSGVLVVWDGMGRRLKFSPSGWLCVEDEVNGGA